MSLSSSLTPRHVVASSNPLAGDGWRGMDRNSAINDYGKKSAAMINRSRLNWSLLTQFIFVLLMTFRLSVAIYVFIGIRPPRYLQRLRLPPATNWEFCWVIGSTLSCLVGAIGVRRRKPVLIRAFIALSFLAGIVTVIYAAVLHVSNDLITYWNTHVTRLYFHGIPVVIIWSMFLAAALQIHGYGMYFAYSLLKAWKARAAVANQAAKTPTS